MDVVVHSDCPPSLEPKQLLKGYGHGYLNLFRCLGYGDNDYPVADWLRLYHKLEGRWLVVTPIYWQATHNDVMLMACDRELNCSEAQAREAFDVFSTFAAEEGMQVHYHDQYTWLLQCHNKPPLTALPPYALIHQSMFAHIQQLDSTLSWQRFLTEVQMLFAQRMRNGSMINGVWIWGDGQLKTPSNRLVWVNHQNQVEMARLLSNNTQLWENSIPSISPRAMHRERSHDSADKPWKVDEKIVRRSRVDIKNALFWFDALSPEEHEILSTQLNPYAVNWYWNNLGYHTKKSSWFTKIFSSLF